MSRLDRLVVLLETGSTPFIRNTAADQLSDLAKGHPEEMISLLGRVYPYLKSPKWETRIAAARAFGGIVNHAELWDPNDPGVIKQEKDLEDLAKKELDQSNLINQEAKTKIKLEDEEIKIKQEQDEELQKITDSMSNLITFSSFNLAELLKCGKRLLASKSEDDMPLDENSLIGKIKKPKLEDDEVLTDSTNIAESPTPPVKQEPINESPDPVVAAPSKASSARLKAMQKRRAKVNAKSNNRVNPVDISKSSISRKLAESEPATNPTTPETPRFDVTSQQGGSKLVMETKVAELSPLLSQHSKVLGLVWQFQGVYELLLNGLFDDKWEVRHGAALGLRELIKNHGKGAGRVMGKSLQENDANNAATLEDLAVRLCVLFCLDRFGDYVSDTVVAPVRESGAQTLAALLKHLDNDVVVKTFHCLYDLVLQNGITVKCWEAKHGGMLGVRYFVSVRTDVLLERSEILDQVVDMVLHGLNENDDDVQAVAALTLTPIASQFVSTKKHLIQTLLQVIWSCLTNLHDDLSASIGSVMDLLAKLCSHEEVIGIIQKNAHENQENSFENLVPKLFMFLRHSITKVRRAVLTTILEFLNIEDPTTKTWINSRALRLIYQNLLVEQNADILRLSSEVFKRLLVELDNNKGVLPSLESLIKDHFLPLFTLTMTPIGIARHTYHMNTNLIMRPSGYLLGSLEDESNGTSKKRKVHEDTSNDIPITDSFKVNIDAPMYKGDVMLVGYETFVAGRCAATSAMGAIVSYIEDDSILESMLKQILSYLSSAHATSKLFAALLLEDYANALKERGKTPSPIAVQLFSEPLLNTLVNPNSLPYFRELVPTLKAVRTSCLQLFDVFITAAKVSPTKVPQLPVVVQGEAEAGPGAFGLENAQNIINVVYGKLKDKLPAISKMSANQSLEDAKHRVQLSIDEATSMRTQRVTGILAAHAAALLAIVGIPKKLSPVIISLMESIKQEETTILQEKSASSVSHLVSELIKAGKLGAADKIVKNLCSYLCVDTSEVPEVEHNKAFVDNILSLRKEEAKTDPADIAAHEKAVHEARIKRQGAMFALKLLIESFGKDLFVKLPKLKSLMLDSLDLLESSSRELVEDVKKGQTIVDGLGILRALLGYLDKSLHSEIVDKLPLLIAGLKSDYSVFRYSSAKCFATVCSVIPTKAIVFLVKHVLPMLNNAGEVKERQGAIETIYHISTTMGADILPYIVFLLVPVLGRMSDSDHDVRVLATTTFAAIIKLVPLEAGIPDPEDMPQELLEGRDRERDFIQQMMDPTKIKPFELPITVNATLRKYQQEGVNWLAFLNKYHLHGILCDDMGLGKTLQTLCIIASDHHIREEKYRETNSAEFKKLSSLIICPPSLTGHWEQEINQYAPFLKVLVYAGGPSIRSSLRSKFSEVDVVVTSYDVCRNDVEYVTAQDYNYCVLDEGHIIKNSASKLTKSVKRVRAKHRLILSGTPIQNNVLELWSLFDFLMPGFLGTEKVFHEKFAKPIAASRNSKTSSKEQEAGALALESLHKQVLPFMLRRLKEDVLSDLPPKIIQDYYCELSDLQKKLYRDFASKQKSVVQEEVQKSGEEATKESKTHVFQALQYMRKLCNHPALVVSPEHPKYEEVMQYLAQHKSDIRSIEHAPKLLSLKTLLLECGIGVNDSSEFSGLSKSKKQQQQQQQLVSAEGVISEHRALIFCQLKDMLDIVENELLKKYLPSVTYMRLDGSTDPRDRQSIVRKFNEDPSIDVLLSTTKVGGLGLNLTGADTVIFVEHDWNPMNDLQAMDRAHRLGQKKVVSVYRLITKYTLEEKIMGLQKFKMNIASTIVNQQNAGLSSMDTNQLLDLFDVDEASANKMDNGKDATEESKLPEDVNNGLTGKASDAVGELADLWDESQYDDEYNLDNFIKTLK